MREKSLRRRIPVNRRATANDPGTPRSFPPPAVRRRIKPSAVGKYQEPRQDEKSLKRSKSEPALLKGIDKKAAAGEDEGVLCRPETWTDIFTSPEISKPPSPLRKHYRKDAKVVVNVTVEGSAGPIRTLVSLGSNVEEIINLVINKYNQEGRTPPLDKHSPSTCLQLHQSYYSLQCLSKSDLIGDVGCRSFYLRKYSSEEHSKEESTSSEDYDHLNSRLLSYRKINEIILRTRKFFKFFGCIPGIG